MADVPVTPKAPQAGAQARFWSWPMLATAAGALLFAALVAMALAVAATAAIAIGAIALAGFGLARLGRKRRQSPTDGPMLEATRTAEGWAVESAHQR